LATATRVSSGWRASISMRMVIDITPAARGGQCLAARVHRGQARPERSGGHSGACEKCLCCNGHPDTRREGRAALL
jgi:hypothetical protein